MKRLFCIFLLSCWGLSLLPAQLTLERQVLAGGGTSSAVSPFVLNHTFGQPIAQSFSAGMLDLNLGFQQSDRIWPVSLTEDFFSQLRVFPNPGRELQSLELSLENPQFLSIYLLDVKGRRLKAVFSGQLEAGTHLLPLRLEDLSAGSYYLSLQDREGLLLGSLSISRY